MLSNDPHLATSIPSIFAQVGLHCRTVTASCPFDVTGFSLAGLPGVVIGKNTTIAWGMTTSYADVQDLYLEQVRGDTVRVGDHYVPLQVRTEEIRVAGRGRAADDHGPLLPARAVAVRRGRVAAADVGARAARAASRPYAVSLSWTALTPNRTMDALLRLDRAHDFDGVPRGRRAAGRAVAEPDLRRHAGQHRLPAARRAARREARVTGCVPSPGLGRRYDWQGTIPFAELPYVYNPPAATRHGQPPGDQLAVSADQIGSEYSYGWRSQEIIDADASAAAALDCAEQFFYDDTIRVAADLVPTLLKIKITDPWVCEGQQTLVGWDYSADRGLGAAAYFNVVVHNILKLTFRDELPEDLWPAGGDRWYAVWSNCWTSRANRWWDATQRQDKVETRDDILLAAMTDARKEITSLMARDTDEWRWGRLHTVTLRNQTLGRSGVGRSRRCSTAATYRGAAGVGGGQRDGLRRHAGLHRDVSGADDADAGRPRRPRPVALGQPERRLRARLPPATTTTRPRCGPQPKCGRSSPPGRRGGPHHRTAWICVPERQSGRKAVGRPGGAIDSDRH